MVPVTPLFPLFKLPYLAWRNVLETMHLFDLIKSSLCSRQLKRFIRSLFLKPSELYIYLAKNKFKMGLRTTSDVNLKLSQLNRTLQGPSILHFADHFDFEKRVEQVSSGFDVKEWVTHLMETFNCDGIDLLINCDWYAIEHVKRVIGGREIHHLHIGTDASNPYLVKLLETFEPSRTIILYQRPEKEEPFFRNFLTRNYQSIILIFRMSLEEILTITSRSIELHSLSTPAEINAVLKRWVDGWNPELADMALSVRINEEDYIPAVFDGLSYNESSRETPAKKEYEIARNDGMKATISTSTSQNVDVHWIQVYTELHSKK